MVNSIKIVLLFTFFSAHVFAQHSQSYELISPDGKIKVVVETGEQLQWSADISGQKVITDSPINIELMDGEILGKNVKVKSNDTKSVNSTFKTILYKKDQIVDEYNELMLEFKGNYGVIFRTYNDGTAYRFYSKRKDSLFIKNEKASFNFEKDYTSFIPYIRDLREGDKYHSACEPLYSKIKLSEFVEDSLSYAPLLVSLDNGVKAVLLEAELEDYPGMFLTINKRSHQGFEGHFAAYPTKERPGGFNQMNYMVTERAKYIAKVSGKRMFPWRVVVISERDADLANNDMIYKLASPNRISDVSWIKPGKVAWDWWNNWSISKVDFEAGINTETYKYYIDFASANKIEYIILDEGWAEETNLKNISEDIDLAEIIKYGDKKNVEIILWSTWLALKEDLDGIFSKYSKMGVKGFKIDFLDRDDQKMNTSIYHIAEVAAQYKLLVDYHGVFKPTGLQRTYPNVINYEAVNGLENAKWANNDMPGVAATLPFTRMVAGPLDYTPGAMHNANRGAFRSIHGTPMSQGTRCQQLAMYVIFEAPIQMLADSPTNYMEEQESTDFIASIPTVFNETVALDGEVGEFIAIARRKGDTWYIGGLSNWNERSMSVDLSFLGEGEFLVELFEDGINANRVATDYTKKTFKTNSSNKLDIKMMSGGGFAAKIIPSK